MNRKGYRWVVAMGMAVMGLSGCAIQQAGMVQGAIAHLNTSDALITGTGLFELWKARQMPAWNVEVRLLAKNNEQGWEAVEIKALESPWTTTHASVGVNMVREGGEKWCQGEYQTITLKSYEEGWSPMILGGQYYAKGRVECHDRRWKKEPVSNPNTLEAAPNMKEGEPLEIRKESSPKKEEPVKTPETIIKPLESERPKEGDKKEEVQKEKNREVEKDWHPSENQWEAQWKESPSKQVISRAIR